MAWFEQVIVWLALFILLFYTYTFFFRLPYIGFDINFVSGHIVHVFINGHPHNTLLPNDKLIQVNTTTWAEFRADLNRPLFPYAKEIDEAPIQVPVTVHRGGKTVELIWSLPAYTWAELESRLLSHWWLPYVFWLLGVIAVKYLRPKDIRWALLIASNFLTAVWLSAGIVSPWHLGESDLVMRATIWFCLPVYWHLHWVFPHPLGRLSKQVIYLSYGICVALAILAWFQVLPSISYLFAFMLAIIGSLGLSQIRFALGADQRRELNFVIAGITIITVLTIGLGFVSLSGTTPPSDVMALLILPVFSFSYLFTAYYYRLDGFQVHANRIIALYLFVLLHGVILLCVSGITRNLVEPPNWTIPIIMVISGIFGLIGGAGFPLIRNWAERCLLRIPLASSQLLESYAVAVTSALDREHLVKIIKDKVLSVLFIQQSALIQFDKDDLTEAIYIQGVCPEQIPQPQQIPPLLDNLHQPCLSFRTANDNYRWIRLILPLYVSNELIGVWLLGKRDPNNTYSLQEIPTLQAIANLTSAVLRNVIQTENLRVLYQTNINRQEQEQSMLALALHDEILSDLAVLGMSVNEVSPQFQNTYKRLTIRLRQTIRDLRPSVLEYGLWIALEQLVEYMTERQDKMMIRFEVTNSQVSYPNQVEHHTLRIIHQAIDNALRHSQGNAIWIRGQLLPGKIDLSVADDGIGFSSDKYCLDLQKLLMNKHFGLVGMYERANLINAQLHIKSKPSEGLELVVCWHQCNDWVEQR